MTDPLQSHDVELLKRYEAELQEIQALHPAAIELPANQALAIVTLIQIGAADPGLEHNPLLPSAIAAAKQIQSSFNPESAIHEVLELGWKQPEESRTPSKIFTSARKRPKGLRRLPPYWPEHNPYDF